MSQQTPTVNLKNLSYEPNKNPLVDVSSIEVGKRRVRSGLAGESLISGQTGEVRATSVIHQIEEKDVDEFVKVFSDGISATYELSKTGQRVFHAILMIYEKTPMNGGYVDSIYLAWFDGGIAGNDIGLKEKTFQRGLKELLGKKFLAPRGPNLFWVNPALFFKGDRAILVKEFRKKQNNDVKKITDDLNQQQLPLEGEDHA